MRRLALRHAERRRILLPDNTAAAASCQLALQLAIGLLELLDLGQFLLAEDDVVELVDAPRLDRQRSGRVTRARRVRRSLTSAMRYVGEAVLDAVQSRKLLGIRRKTRAVNASVVVGVDGGRASGGAFW